MPKCWSCSKNYDDPTVIELVKNQNNRWISICRHCLAQGVDVNLIEPASHIAVDDHALAATDHPAIDVTRSDNPLENAKKLLDALRNLRQSKERVGRVRSHERKQVELIVYYMLSRDDTRHEGIVKNFSQGGLRIATDHQLTIGQVVQFDWNIPIPPAIMKTLQSNAEVKRVTKDEDGRYDVGLKFITRRVDEGANRRRFRRYRCNMLVYYQRNGSDIMSSGSVIDISQGGCQMRLDEKLEPNEVFQARLIGGGGARGDLMGNMRVCRVLPREINYDTGCAFEKMRMEQ